jgi:hypothetical protein
MTVRDSFCSVLRAAWIVCFSTATWIVPAGSAAAVDGSPFTPLLGRWVGEGKLGVKENPPEIVKCRVTYIAAEDADHLKQNIRCATAGGSIEVLSAVAHKAGQLSGTWVETTHNISGDLTGQVTARGFRVQVKGGELAANMDIILRNDKQIVEIQFFNSVLFGLSMELTKG